VSKKMTTTDFKKAVQLDGNLCFGVNKLLYVLRQIEYAYKDGKLTEKQMDKLWNWAYDKFGN